MTMEQQMEKPRSKIWPKVLLAVSLSLNLLVIGIIAGTVLKFGPGGHHRHRGLDLDVQPMIQALSRSDRAALRRSFAREMTTVREARADLPSRAESILQALRTEPFDQAALQTVLDAQKQQLAERHKAGQQILFDQISAMSERERATYADRLEEEFSRRPRFRRYHSGG
ncbi:periplasmic heavy metal sensor [Pseudohalocynthiibacter aestuariivivens]